MLSNGKKGLIVKPLYAPHGADKNAHFQWMNMDLQGWTNLPHPMSQSCFSTFLLEICVFPRKNKAEHEQTNIHKIKYYVRCFIFFFFI